MNTSLVCLAVALAAPAVEEPPPIYTPVRVFDTVIRGQNGNVPGPGNNNYEEIPMTGQPGATSGNPQTFVGPEAVPNGGLITPQYTPAYQPGADPFLAPQYGAAPGTMQPGVNGVQPYRLNRWVSRYEFGLLPKESTSNGLGNFGIFEFDGEWEYSTPVVSGWIFSFAPQFGVRAWDGPSSSVMVPTTALPGSVYRAGLNFELATPANGYGPLAASLAFNPSVNSDFESGLSSNAWNWDGRGMLFYHATPQWTWVLGAGYWDRVNDRVIPYAGFIYRPSSNWEWRIVLPDPRVSVFLGNAWGLPTWFYARGEYHVEAYEIQLETTGMREKVEIEDYRILMGLRFDNGYYASFVEAGWVFGRDVDFRNGTPGFDISSGFIARAGFRF